MICVHYACKSLTKILMNFFNLKIKQTKIFYIITINVIIVRWNRFEDQDFRVKHAEIMIFVKVKNVL